MVREFSICHSCWAGVFLFTILDGQGVFYLPLLLGRGVFCLPFLMGREFSVYHCPAWLPASYPLGTGSSLPREREAKEF
jgi:hypothetical protein